MVEIGAAVSEFLRGDYGFLTVLLIIIGSIWLILQWKKRVKVKRLKAEGIPIPPGLMSKKERIAMKKQSMNPEQVQPQQVQQQPAMPPPPMQQPIASAQAMPTTAKEEPLFNMDSIDAEGKSLQTVEEDAISILKKKTEDTEIGLVKEKEVIEKKLMEINDTENGIKDIVSHLKVKFQQIQRQKKTYQLMKRSLQISGGEGGLIR